MRLEGKEDVELFYDKTRSFGTFLLTQVSDSEWDTILTNLQRAQTIMLKPKPFHLFHEEIIPLEKSVQSFLEEKFDTLDPVSQFIAIYFFHPCDYNIMQ